MLILVDIREIDFFFKSQYQKRSKPCQENSEGEILETTLPACKFHDQFSYNSYPKNLI